ncbi:hypothetical protein NPIL_73151 [Nephila pilipes]|uniref:Uncharacterized protein n=1 Tax=Nephila pilipes TaxID=299642 RepID=A0A8X6MRF3_NEPPI|nr:hypothetical protein NPIL_73151 [Nephila pilipes]
MEQNLEGVQKIKMLWNRFCPGRYVIHFKCSVFRDISVSCGETRPSFLESSSLSKSSRDVARPFIAFVINCSLLSSASYALHSIMLAFFPSFSSFFPIPKHFSSWIIPYLLPIVLVKKRENIPPPSQKSRTYKVPGSHEMNSLADDVTSTDHSVPPPHFSLFET